jgi:hypothetical protein
VPLTSEELLFTFRDGRPGQFQDVMDDGLDGGYEGRIAPLGKLMAEGSPYHRLLAAVMLASWAVPAGLEQVESWAKARATVPWAGSPVTVDRISGADSAYAMLADAVGTSFLVSPPGLGSKQMAALRALLGLVGQSELGQALTTAIAADRSGAALRALTGDLKAAVERLVALVERGENPGFDAALEAASLMSLLAEADDNAAATLASRLIKTAGDRRRPMLALLDALPYAGPATRSVLSRLADPTSPVHQEARDRIARTEK